MHPYIMGEYFLISINIFCVDHCYIHLLQQQQKNKNNSDFAFV